MSHHDNADRKLSAINNLAKRLNDEVSKLVKKDCGADKDAAINPVVAALAAGNNIVSRAKMLGTEEFDHKYADKVHHNLIT